MNNKQIMALARKHLGNGAPMESSARLCLADAVECDNAGMYDYSAARALKALQYLVGCFHPDFKKANRYHEVTE